jgi:Flp pilus assembly protein TadG
MVLDHPQRRSSDARSGHRRRSPRSLGQAVTEFALLLPLLLAFLGLSIDFARVFPAWMTLESATRDAAESAATNATTSDGALTTARRVVCLQAHNLSGFAPSASAPPNDIEQCVAPNVSVTAFSLSTTAPGASTRYPIGTATVRVTLPFRTIFGYPIITQNGAWTITTVSSYSVVQGRK